MKFCLISDLHSSADEYLFHEQLAKDVEAGEPDVILIAGDFANTHKKNLIRSTTKMMGEIAPTIYVMGNHDFYWNEESTPEDHSIGSVVHDGVRIIYGTLWTNYFGEDPLEKYWSQRGLSDFRYIPEWTTERQVTCFDSDLRNMEWILEEESLPTVILTHHAPSRKCIHPKYEQTMLNGSFVNELDDWILHRPDIKVWCHGHVHDSIDVMVGPTRILAHPRGYRGETNHTNYKPTFFEVNP